MKPYKIIFFDLDGTLADTSPGVIGSLKYTLKKLQLPQPNQADMQSFLGERIRDFLRRVYQLNETQTERFVSIFRQEYAQNRLFQAKLYPGIPQTLRCLKVHGIKTAVATNKPQHWAVDLINFFHLTDSFDLILGCDEEGKLMKSQLIAQGIQQLSPGSGAVLAGDTVGDLVCAQESGIDFIQVLYGFGFDSRDTAQRAVFAAQTPIEIAKYILG